MKEQSHIFGRKPVQEILANSPDRIVQIFIEERLKPESFPTDLAALIGEHRSLVLSTPRAKLDGIAPGNHQGIVALVRPKLEVPLSVIIEQAQLSPGEIILVLDEVADPQNLGSILRAAEAFQVAGVILTKRRSAAISPVVARVSAGASELVSICTVPNLQRALEQLKEAGIWVVGAALGEGSVSLEKSTLPFPQALVLGSEGEGLRQLTKKLCDQLVEIPLPGRMQSLNVNQACSVLLFESKRQWNEQQNGKSKRGGNE